MKLYLPSFLLLFFAITASADAGLPYLFINVTSSAVKPRENGAVFTVALNASAFGGDIRVPQKGIEYEVSGIPKKNLTVVSSIVSTGEVSPAGEFLIRDGEKQQLTLTVAVTSTSEGVAKLDLKKIRWRSGKDAPTELVFPQKGFSTDHQKMSKEKK